jgi:hypothetical protein
LERFANLARKIATRQRRLKATLVRLLANVEFPWAGSRRRQKQAGRDRAAKFS